MTKELREQIQGEYLPRRLPHIDGTAAECRSLAALFSLSESDTERLCAAALLHDCTKRWSREEHLRYLAEQGVKPDEDTLRAEKTLHAVTGALYAAEKYPTLIDAPLQIAIRYHTTGRKEMSLPEKLLYLADYIEPNRTFPTCVTLRRCFYDRIGTAEDRVKCLDEILLLSFEMTIAELLREEQPIHPDTVAARNFLLSQRAAEHERK